MRGIHAWVAVGVLGVGLLSGCSSDGTEQAADVTVNLMGTWTGESQYAAPDGTIKGDAETLNVTRQQDDMFWGTIAFTDVDGSQVQAPITGTLTSDGGIVLTEAGTLWQGEVDGTSMTVVVSWTKGKGDHGACEMVMTKQ